MAIVPVIKYDGPSDVLAWKHPNEELSTWTQLIVNESQEAALVKGGQLVEVFTAGRHTLNTANVPILRRIVNLPFGGKSPFTAEVWYINRAHKLSIAWGTPTPVQVQDPKYGIMAPIRVNGVLGVQVVDTRKFLTQLVGTVASLDEASISFAIRGLYIARVKDTIAQYVIAHKISILELNAYISELSTKIQSMLIDQLAAYGLNLLHFSINEICIPDDDPAVAQLKASLAKRADMGIAGYTYQQERTFDVLEAAARNEGSVSSAFVSAGMGIGIGNSFGAQVVQMSQSIQSVAESNVKIKCSFCGALQKSDAKFCDQCGKAFSQTCKKCGQVLNPDSKFCSTCGEKV